MAGIKGKINAKDLEKFQAAMKKMSKTQTRQFTESSLKELAARLLEKVIKITPVKTGELHRNWTAGEVRKIGDVFEIDVINPLEYAPYVEFGDRTANHVGWVEGKFMLTISEQELQADAPRVLANKLKKFMGGVFA